MGNILSQSLLGWRLSRTTDQGHKGGGAKYQSGELGHTTLLNLSAGTCIWSTQRVEMWVLGSSLKVLLLKVLLLMIKALRTYWNVRSACLLFKKYEQTCMKFCHQEVVSKDHWDNLFKKEHNFVISNPLCLIKVPDFIGSSRKLLFTSLLLDWH